MTIKKTITNGYIDFSLEASKFIEYWAPAHKNADKRTWAAIIIDYNTAKDFDRDFFDFTNLEVEIQQFCVGDVINLRNVRYLSRSKSHRYDGYFLVTLVTQNVVTLEEYPTVAKAVNAQKKRNNQLVANAQKVVSSTNVLCNSFPFGFKTI